MTPSTLLAVTNNAVSTLAGAVNNSSDPVTFSVATGEGALFPSTFPFHITIDSEILSCTNRVTDSLTASRAQQGTTIASHSSGATVELRVTAKSISDLNTAVNALESTSSTPQYAGLGLGVAANTGAARLITGSGAVTTAAEGIQLGTTSPVNLFRSGTNVATLTGQLTIDQSAGSNLLSNVLLETTLGAVRSATAVNAGATTALNASGGARGYVFSGTYNVTGNPNAQPFIGFNFGPVVNLSDTAGNKLNTPNIFQSAGIVNFPLTARAQGNLGATWSSFKDGTTYTTAGASGDTATVTAHFSFQSASVVGVGWTVSTYNALRVAVPTGSGTIGTLVGVDILDLNTFAGTKTNTPISLRSTGTAVQMLHAGPAIFGASVTPLSASGIDIVGDFGTRFATVTLANGVNDDIAIGSKSYVRIAGPTGAFSISSVGTAYDGKRLTIYNSTSQAMTISHEAGTGTAANRIHTMDGKNIVAASEGTVSLIYDQTLTRWLLVGRTPTVAASEVEIDVGSTPVEDATVNTTDANVTTASKIIWSLSGIAPTGKDEDELEMDDLMIVPHPRAGSIDWYVRGQEGYIADRFKIEYLVA